ncbi:twin-arginine translocation signal domain-containing protein [Planctomyces sp. SH-PL62]|uniref:twin-arginine translocation signal domain-containing protein n=1 Tax=Planctomyces sp. SH-PL62 TaxID=1636152 RepID=UPI00078C94FF|nr:twin-arginine translocation signal domain-containing protein [Planctomyces sp. SH-PL62]AMV37750.1 NHL repeat protein [Planctomyces sp. SH-PL62]
MDRRGFLKQGAVAALAASASSPAGPFIHAADKAGTKAPIVGEGEHRYECRHDFFQAPGSIRWFETHGVAVDSQGFIYVTHRGGPTKPRTAAEAQDTIAVYDPEGKFVRSFGKAYHGGGHGIDVRIEDGVEYLYLACMMPVDIVVKTDLKGEVVWLKEAPPEPHVYDKPDAKFAPTNVAFAPDGGFFVADGYGSNYIHKYDKDARWVKTFGGTGESEGKFKTPHGVWLDDRPGREPGLVVADRANARLQRFTLDGDHVGQDNHEVSFPAHFDIRGDVLLVPDLHARITLMGRDDKVLTHLGYDPEWTRQVLDGFKIRSQPDRWPAGKFIHPHDACFDRDGNILVAEWVATGRVSFLKRVG